MPDRSAFAGSVATTNRLVRTMVQLADVSLINAIRMMTLTPARILHIDKSKGSLEAGKDADIVISTIKLISFTQYQKAMLSIVNETETKVFQQNQLTVKIYPTVQQMGKAAAQEVADRICNLLEGKAEINMIFAAAPSQEEFLHHLISDQRISWNRINAFHMDEYIGVLPDAPQSFGNFLRIRILIRYLSRMSII